MGMLRGKWSLNVLFFLFTEPNGKLFIIYVLEGHGARGNLYAIIIDFFPLSYYFHPHVEGVEYDGLKYLSRLRNVTVT